VHQLLQKTLGSYAEVRAVVSSSGRDASTRVFEPEQHNLHAEARATARVLSRALVAAATSLRAKAKAKLPSDGQGQAWAVCSRITGWLLTEAQNALDLLHASSQLSFDCCSGGATFDPRVFLWCDGSLFAAAELLEGGGLEQEEAETDEAALLSAVPRAAEVAAAARQALDSAKGVHPSLVESLRRLAEA